MPRTSIKGQVLANLVAEFAECSEEMNIEKQGMDEKSVGTISVQCSTPWEVFLDRAANQRGSRVGLVLVSPEKITIEKSLRLGFSITNNEAEYEALLMGTMMVQKMGGKGLFRFKTDGGPSKRRIGSTRSKNAGVLEPSQEYTNKI